MSDPIRVPASEHTRPGSFLGPEQRATAWERLGSEQFDVVVIGGGVVGSGCCAGRRHPRAESRAGGSA